MLYRFCPTVEAAPRGRNLRLHTVALLGTSLLSGLLLNPPVARAEVVTDGTVGRREARRGPNFTVPDELGRRRGGNLFHSFERFGIANGESVTFTGPRGIDNVISRVTGEEASTIDGVLASKIPGADFYLVNPKGIVFGPNASLDVSGSFHASTAEELRFADGAVFSALDISGSRLSVAEPRAFGFLGAPATGITVNQSLLGASRGGDTSLVAGDVLVQGSGPTGSVGQVASLGGRLTIVAQGSTGEVAVATGDVSVASAGTAQLRDGARLVAFSGADAGGSVIVRAGRFSMTNGSAVFGITAGAADPQGDISVIAGSLSLNEGSVISTAPAESGAGRGSDLRIVADRLDVLNGSTITALPSVRPAPRGAAIDVQVGDLFIAGGPDGRATGIFNLPNDFSDLQAGSAGGPINIIADELVSIRNGGLISTGTFGVSNGGIIDIQAGNVLISGDGSPLFTGIRSSTFNGSGLGGDIDIVSRGDTQILNGGTVSSSSTASSGAAGTISVAARSLRISGEGSPVSTGIDADSLFSSGAAGSINVVADRITVEGPASATGNVSISSDTAGGSGKAGTVAVTANEQLELRGGGQISSRTRSGGGGSAGTVTVNAPNLLIFGDGARRFENNDTSGFTGITSSALEGSLGSAGTVNVTADRITIARRDAGDRAGITSDTAGSGNAGAITVVSSDRVEIRDGGAVSSSTFAAGDAGTVTVTANDLLIDAEGYEEFATGILSQAEPGSTGPAGRVTISANDLQLRGGGQIASSTFGEKQAGTVVVAAGDLFVSSEGFERFLTGITSQSNPESLGAAGTVVVITSGDVEVRGDNGQITSKSLGSGNAGSVLVAGSRVLVKDGGSITSESDDGQAGLAVVQAGEVVVDDASIRTSSQGFAGGLIQITAEDLIRLKDAEVTTNGVSARPGASLITLDAPDIILDASRVTSLTGDGQPLPGAGEARLLGQRTIVSADSFVAGTTAVEIAGLQQNLGSGLQLPPGAFLDTGRLLRESCAARGGGATRSSFTRAGRGGLPPAPDRPLGSAGAGKPLTGDPRAGGTGTVAFEVACGGPAAKRPPQF